MKKNQHTSVDLMEFSQGQVHYSLEIIYPFVKSSLTTTKKNPRTQLGIQKEYQNTNSLHANGQTNITHILAAMSNSENQWYKQKG